MTISTISDMKIAIMQPTYLPWIGYFDLIDSVDIFVFLDNVQFEKQTWQQRNRLRAHKGLEWITVPVLTKGQFGQHIKDVELRDTTFVVKHLKQITQSYQKAKEFHRYFADFSGVLQQAASKGSLCHLNVTLIKWLCSKFQISTKFIMASELNIQGKRSERIVNILKALNAFMYISPQGSEHYIVNDYQIFEGNDISVFYHQYLHPEYVQVYRPFLPYACSLDVLLNEGEKSLGIIKLGKKDPLPAKEGVMS